MGRAELVAKVSGGVDPEAGSSVSFQDPVPTWVGVEGTTRGRWGTGRGLAREREGKGMVGG